MDTVFLYIMTLLFLNTDSNSPTVHSTPEHDKLLNPKQDASSIF